MGGRRLYSGGAEQNSEKDFELHQPDYARIMIEITSGTYFRTEFFGFHRFLPVSRKVKIQFTDLFSDIPKTGYKDVQTQNTSLNYPVPQLMILLILTVKVINVTF